MAYASQIKAIAGTAWFLSSVEPLQMIVYSVSDNSKSADATETRARNHLDHR
jgi:hypothetical protein